MKQAFLQDILQTPQDPDRMVLPDRSIQHFYQKHASPPSQPANQGSLGENQAFTPAEIEAARRPATQTWTPKGLYEHFDINQLQPGPGKICFQGRIVNFCHAKNGSRRGNSLPQDFHFLIVKDNTGVAAVSHHTANSPLVAEPGP